MSRSTPPSEAARHLVAWLRADSPGELPEEAFTWVRAALWMHYQEGAAVDDTLGLRQPGGRSLRHRMQRSYRNHHIAKAFAHLTKARPEATESAVLDELAATIQLHQERLEDGTEPLNGTPVLSALWRASVEGMRLPTSVKQLRRVLEQVAERG